jgi:hypothetical protein
LLRLLPHVLLLQQPPQAASLPGTQRVELLPKLPQQQ